MANDIAAITQLVLHERNGRDRARWDQMRACFHPDSTVNLSWYKGNGEGFVAGSERMSKGGSRILHRLAPPVIDINGTRGVVELGNVAETRIALHGVESDLSAHSRLLYRVEQREGVWKLLSLDAIYERDTLIPVLPGAALTLDAKLLAEQRPSYRYLGYHLGTLGVTVPKDLYGDDQPDAVAELYRSAFTWAGLIL